MAISYSWKNIELKAYKNMYEQTDVVFMIDADLEATENNITKVKPVSVGVQYNSEGNFIAIDSVTKDNAISWLESNLGDNLQKYKDELASHFQFTIRKIED